MVVLLLIYLIIAVVIGALLYREELHSVSEVFMVASLWPVSLVLFAWYAALALSLTKFFRKSK